LATPSPLFVLIVDDEPDIRDLVSNYLIGQGMQTVEADSEASMQSQMKEREPDVILLDVNLGFEDGFAIARRLRQSWQGGLLMVTGRGDTIDRVVGLELGADDYVTKPFELRELLARVRSVGRRTAVESSARPESLPGIDSVRIAFDGFLLCRSSRLLTDHSGKVVALTTGEFDLLCALIQHPGRVMSRDELLRQTHNRDAGPFDRTIDVQVGRLRKKLGDTDDPPRIIKSVRGAGYLLGVPVRHTASAAP
jgi:two-component system, OmpR family, response regulator